MPNVGLVLSGGFAKGAYQLGVLKALSEYFYGDNSIKYISASSVGVLNAYAYAANELDLAEKTWLNLKFNGYRSFINAYKRALFLDDAIEAVAASSNRVKCDFYAACFNVSRLKLNYVNFNKLKTRSELKDFLRASVSLPVFSKAMEIGGDKYIDGALVDNIPVAPLLNHNVDYAIVVHFDAEDYIFENEFFDGKLIKINFIGNSLVKDSLAFDKKSISDMIAQGKKESAELFSIIFQNGISDLDYIYRKIEFLNSLRSSANSDNSGNRRRLTGDAVVSNLNKVLKKIAIIK